MTHTAEQELTKLAKLKPFKRGDRQAFLADLLKGLDKTLDNMKKSEADKAYEALPLEAKEWYQGCIDRQDANPEAELPEFEEDRDDPDDDDDRHARNGDGGDADDIPFDAGADDEDEPEPAPKPVAKAKQPPVKRKPITLSPPKPEKAKAEAPAPKPTSRGVTLRPVRKPFKPAPVAAKRANGPVKGARGNGIINVIIATVWRHPKDTVQELRARLEKRNVQTSEVTIAQERRTFKRQVAFLVQEGVIDKNPFAEKH